MHRPSILAAVLLGALACRPAQPATAAGTSAQPVVVAPARPLAPFATARVLVAPVATLGAADPLDWNGRTGDPIAFLRAVDAEIATALSGRSALPWVYADALARSYRRNASLSHDPYRLSVDVLRAAPLAKPPQFTGEPLASQLRGIVALQEDARMALLPVELRFEPATDVSPQAGRAVLRLALVDARSTDVRWLGEVRTDAMSAFSAPGIAKALAARVADLVASPPAQ